MPEKKQKVLIVHNYYQIPGGEDTVVANEKKLLEDHGHEVVLYTRHNSELKTFSKVQKLLLPISTVFSFRTYREVKALIQKEKIDVVHVHNTLNLISPSVYYAAFCSRVPVVQTIHNFRLLCPGATFFRDGHICEDCVTQGLSCAVKHKCYRGSRVQTLACVISTQIHRFLGTYKKLNYICLTEFNKEKLLQLKQIQAEQVFVKPNFVEAAKEIVPHDKRKKQFIYVGRLDKLKGVDLLLKAWETFSKEDYHLVICGTGPMEEWCKEYTKNHQLKNVELKGFVDNENAKRLIGESLALILPTQWYEGFPMTILEAYSTGTPVIGSRIGNVGNLVKEAINGIHFEPWSESELLKAITDLSIDHKIVFEYFQTHYSREVNYEILKSIYEKLV